jgi:hypothetical protein
MPEKPDQFDDFPEWAREGLRQAKHEEIERLTNEALRVLAVGMRKLQINQVTLTRDEKGTVRAAVLGDAEGKSHGHYAVMDWRTVQMPVSGRLPAPKVEQIHGTEEAKK